VLLIGLNFIEKEKDLLLTYFCKMCSVIIYTLSCHPKSLWLSFFYWTQKARWCGDT